MQILNNPFISNTFSKIWESKFSPKSPLKSFKTFNTLKFFKPYPLPIYINAGKNLTKGISFEIQNTVAPEEISKKAFIIYDVPQYFKIPTTPNLPNFKVKSIQQYPGYLINLKKYANCNTYLKQTFSKSSVQKFNRYQKRLEHCFNITDKMLMGSIDKTEYDVVFKHFKHLLTKRFDDKQIINNNLNPKEWVFYEEVAYAMLLENKAALHVVYSNNTPISIRLLYFSDTIIFDAITVFDIDYAKFHIGKVSLMKVLDWSFNSPYQIFDFSKGYFDYKESWSDLKYHFNYLIYYDASSWQASLCAKAYAYYFKFKQYLRDKNINETLHKLPYRFKASKSNKTNTLQPIDLDNMDLETLDLTPVDIHKTNTHFLKKHAFDFLFLSSEHINHLQVYEFKHPSYGACYLLQAQQQKLILHKP